MPDELLGLRRGDGAQDDPFQDAEDSAAPADAERQRDHRRGGEPGRARERAQGKSQVLQDGVHAAG